MRISKGINSISTMMKPAAAGLQGPCEAGDDGPPCLSSLFAEHAAVQFVTDTEDGKLSWPCDASPMGAQNVWH